MSALHAALTELQLNIVQAEHTHPVAIWVPFQRAALDAALLYLPTLPDAAYATVVQASQRIYTYNLYATVMVPIAQEEFTKGDQIAKDLKYERTLALPIFEAAARDLDDYFHKDKPVLLHTRNVDDV